MLGTYDFSHITVFLSTWGVIFYTVNLLYFNKSLLVSMQMGIKYMTCIFLYIIEHYTPSGKKKNKVMKLRKKKPPPLLQVTAEPIKPVYMLELMNVIQLGG